ncbi:hypothetical protein AUEXF2481DRAFT_320490 [Aureobasidium subglaciale EXF-2481]|uniref:Uncharacterized protein n=1 Tax=Aureobasidium subglaciale (strain EXF-2481) TaxID=1043005 RepID=A0A074YD27_AURSE|nr:uncharacterized protein AUEXF2481DRAFT_320490 [Aureobasidium subglaciale EXF-2481]KEQ93959.1 hypothetical protein AUEXF2481DRAFT_320490 [Aureobasidium subglaciale EXF-2481]
MHGLRHSLQRPLVSAAMSPIRLSSVTRQLSALSLIPSCRRFLSTFIIASALHLISKSFDACPLGPSLDPSNIHLAISGFARQELNLVLSSLHHASCSIHRLYHGRCWLCNMSQLEAESLYSSLHCLVNGSHASAQS